MNTLFNIKNNDIFYIKNNFKEFEKVKSRLIFNDSKVLKPEVSILIPTYRKINRLIDAIKSCITQNNAPSYEVIIVNDNYEDSDAIKAYLTTLNSNKTKLYTNETNLGLFGNWNRCIELATSDYIVYCHDDDLLSTDCLSELWKCHLKNEANAAICGRPNVIEIKSNKLLYSRLPISKLSFLKTKTQYKFNWISLLLGESDNGCGCLFCRNTMIKLGGWDPDFYPASDAVLFYNYQTIANIYRINKITRITRVGENESQLVSSMYPKCNYYLQKKIIDKFFNHSKILKYIAWQSFLMSSKGIYKKPNIIIKSLIKARNTLFYYIQNFRIR